jgi:hypothetical protein
MQAPHAADLLDAWDAGAHASGAERALLLARLTGNESIEELANRPLGWIAAQLLQLRGALIGPILVSLADCRSCDTVVESRIQIDELIAMATSRSTAQSGALHRVNADSVDIEFRLPTCRDLLALRGDTQEASLSLAEAVIASATCDGRTLSAREVAVTARAPIERAILDLDPLVRVDLEIVCPACGRSWAESLPVTDFVWTEVSDLASRVIYDVARLASAFGWQEQDILAMSEHRRRQYLELLPS